MARALDLAEDHGADWWAWRIASSGHIKDSFADVRYRWAFRDVVEALAVLDAYDVLVEVERERVERDARRRS